MHLKYRFELEYMETVSIEEATAKRTFHSLDGLRGIAALCVVLLHYGMYVKPLSIGSGYLAVDLFFGLSGFVIGYAYHNRLKDSISPIRFFVLRFVRLYPMYLFGTMIFIITPMVGLALHISRNWTWSTLTFSALPALVMLPGPDQDGGWNLLYPLNYPAWSLIFELIANVVYATLLWTKSWRLGRILVAAAGVGCVVAACSYGNIDSGPSWAGLWIGLARVGFSFGIGIWIFHLHRSGRLPLLKVPPILVMALVAVVLAAAPPVGIRALYDLTCIIVVFPICIIACIGREPKAGLGIFSALGLISYPLYTIHLPSSYVLSRMCDHIFRTDATQHTPWIGGGMILFLGAASLLLAKYYDPWARDLLSHRVLSRQNH
jgi:peptidoglycan/LPS O-acetylase OafA/YrhL